MMLRHRVITRGAWYQWLYADEYVIPFISVYGYTPRVMMAADDRGSLRVAHLYMKYNLFAFDMEMHVYDIKARDVSSLSIISLNFRLDVLQLSKQF